MQDLTFHAKIGESLHIFWMPFHANIGESLHEMSKPVFWVKYEQFTQRAKREA